MKSLKLTIFLVTVSVAVMYFNLDFSKSINNELRLTNFERTAIAQYEPPNIFVWRFHYYYYSQTVVYNNTCYYDVRKCCVYQCEDDYFDTECTQDGNLPSCTPGTNYLGRSYCVQIDEHNLPCNF